MISIFSKVCNSSKLTFLPPFRNAVTGRHSKNVAAKKNKLDGIKRKLNYRYSVKIFMAAKSGGVDPTSNSELNKVLREAHSIKIPKDVVERALKKAEHGNTNQENYSSGIYEIFGLGGVSIILCTLSDNSNRTLASIKTVIKKSEAKIASHGSLLFKFDHKAIFETNDALNRDAVIEAAIEYDLDDIDFLERDPIPHNETSPSQWIVTSPSDLHKLQEMAHHLNLSGSSHVVYIPNELQDVLDEEYYSQNLHLIESFENLDDVDSVFHDLNIHE